VEYDHQRAAAQTAQLRAYAGLGISRDNQIPSGRAGTRWPLSAYSGAPLGPCFAAVAHGLWEEAQALAQPLNDYWVARGLNQEAQGWIDRARLVLEMRMAARRHLTVRPAPCGRSVRVHKPTARWMRFTSTLQIACTATSSIRCRRKPDSPQRSE
jgi:hypothetical protein